MKRAAWLLVLALLVAGCLGATDPPKQDAPPDASREANQPSPGFEGPIVAGEYANDQREAFVDVSEDGQTVLTCAHGEFQRPSHMYASTDGGSTWRSLTAEPTPGSGGDCEVALSPNGSWAFLHSTVASATIVTTQDGGETWTVNPLTAVPVTGLADRPYIKYVGEQLLLTYQPGNEPGRIGVTYSDDHGETWSTPQTLGPVEGATPNPMTQDILVAPDGETVRVPISLGVEPLGLTGTDPHQGFAVSRDRGESWTFEPVDAPNAAHGHPTAAQDGQGTLYWIYQEQTAGLDLEDPPWQLVLSSDGGDTWSKPHTVGENPAWPRPWADGRPSGGLDFLWQKDTNDRVDIISTRIDTNGTRTAN